MLGREFWEKTVGEYESSEETQAEFARQREVAVTTLRWWIYKLRRERSGSVSFMPVRVVGSTAPTARRGGEAGSEIEVELKSGVRLRLSTSVDIEYVSALAQRLG